MKSLIFTFVLVIIALTNLSAADCTNNFSTSASIATAQYVSHLNNCWSPLGVLWNVITGDGPGAILDVVEGLRCIDSATSIYNSAIDNLVGIWCRCMELNGC
jgi:hypothetical protein